VVLGFKTLKDDVTEDSPPVTANGGPYFGDTIGRFGNRIAKGAFQLFQPSLGKTGTCTLPVNKWREQPARWHRRFRQPHRVGGHCSRSTRGRRAVEAGQPQR
jgi:hypothetical protein